MVTKRRLGLCSNHGPIRFRRPIRRRNSRRRSERRGAGRLAAAALAPARRADCYADQPTVGTSISVLGAFAERAGRRRRSGLWRGVLRRRQPRFVGSSSSPRSAVRRGAAPAPRLARRDRLRRPDAPSRGFFRAARRRASFAQRRRERAHQPRRAHPSAVARFRRAFGRV